MRFLWALPAWLLLVASLLLPQLAYYFTGSVVLAVFVTLVPVGLMGWLMLHVAPTLNTAIAGFIISAALAGVVGGFGGSHFQATALLAADKALEGVTLGEVLASGDQGVWVRLTDARVRSEATYTMSFVSGTKGRPGQPGTQTTSTHVLAPVTLASAVPREETFMRPPPTGPIALWACAGDSFTLHDWDSERQAVRGTLRRIEDHVVESLSKQLSPESPAPIPGAGAMPPAPGVNGMPPGDRARFGFPDMSGPSGPAVAPSTSFSLAPDAWCVHLDRTLDAATAKANALTTALMLLFMVPLFVVGLLMIVLHPDKPGAKTT